MVKKAKYPDTALSSEEEKIIDDFAFKYVATYSAIIEKYRTPKRFAKELILTSI